MGKRDKIFYWACGLFGAGIVLAVLEYDVAMLFFAAAYLLRPTLHAFDLAPSFADERQVQVHSRSGNIAFIAVVLAVVGFALSRLSKGEQPEDLYAILTIGVAARAIAGLLMWGELRKAASTIIMVVGAVVALFVFVSDGFSTGSLFVGGVALGFASLGLVARKAPRTIGIILAIAALALIFFLRLYEFRAVNLAMWMVVVCIAIAALSLYRGTTTDLEERPKHSKSARTVGLIVGAAALLIFFIYLSLKPNEGKVSSTSSGQTLSAPADIQGVSCQGHVEYYSNGTLKTCTLAREDTLSGQPLAEGTVVNFTADGVLDWCFLQHDTEIQGHLCKGRGHGWMTSFYPNGKLKVAWLGREEVIQGIPCAEYSFWTDAFGGGAATYFYESGNLKRCRLADTVTIGGKLLTKGNWAAFDENGNYLGN
jgi:hypothetical protein